MKKFKWNKILGLVFMSPAILGVLLFFITLFTETPEFLNAFNRFYFWSGNIDWAEDSGGGGYSSPMPIYLGLMAIAGAILFSKGSNRERV